MVLLDNGGRPRRHLEIVPPPDDLRGLVEHLWIQGHSDRTHDWRVVPDASPHLIASVVESPAGRRLRVALVGPRSHAAAIDMRNRLLTVGVRLRPGALSALVRQPAAELRDRAPAIADIFSRRVTEGLELAADAPPSLLAGELIRVVRRTARRSTIGAMAGEIANLAAPVMNTGWPAGAGKAERVRAVIEALAVPERTLRDRVHREIGLAPKPVLRILRLHRALMLARRPGRTWADIAQMAGYADQSHLSRECRSLLGETPCRWAARGLAVSFKTAQRLQA